MSLFFPPPGFHSPFHKTDSLSGSENNYWPIRDPEVFRVDQILCSQYNENDHLAYTEWLGTKVEPERVMEIQSKILRDLNGNMVSLSHQSVNDDGDNHLKRQNIALAAKLRALEEYRYSGNLFAGDLSQVHSTKRVNAILKKYGEDIYPGYSELIDMRQYRNPSAQIVRENAERVSRYLDHNTNEYHGGYEDEDNFSPYRDISCQYGLPPIRSLLERAPENAIRQRIMVLMQNANSPHGLSTTEKDELLIGMKKYRVYIDSGASMSVVKHLAMLIPGTFRPCEGNIFSSTPQDEPVTIEGRGQISFMGRRIGVLYSSRILENVLSEGCLCQTYSFRIAKDGPYVTITDKLSPQHRNVAFWRIQGKMYPVPEGLLR